MNAKMQKWAELLESGKYEQGCGALKRGERYCCLGVAREGVFGGESEGDKALYPAELESLGLTEADQGLLIEANDCEGMSFPEIATALYLADVSGLPIAHVLTP